MWIRGTLGILGKLLDSWGLQINDWCIVSEYAWRYNGYRYPVRLRHIDIFVKKNKLPWKVLPEAESTVPPSATSYFKGYISFMRRTRADMHLIPLPAGPTPVSCIIDGSSVTPISHDQKVRVIRLDADIQHRVAIVRNCALSSNWGPQKILRWKKDFANLQAIARKRNDTAVVRACNEGLRYLRIFSQSNTKTPYAIFNIPSDTLKGYSVGIKHQEIIRGRVHVVRNAKDLRRGLSEAILVASKTTPMFTEYIQKTRAVITDEGGILSHAATIARELGVPCIIGTQKATKIFKTGDRVEIDSIHGIVKKLK